MYCRAYLPLSSSKKTNNWMIFVLISVRPIQSCPLKDPQIFSNRFQPSGDHHCDPLFTSICRQRFGRGLQSLDDGSNLWKQWEESPVIFTRRKVRTGGNCTESTWSCQWKKRAVMSCFRLWLLGKNQQQKTSVTCQYLNGLHTADRNGAS